MKSDIVETAMHPEPERIEQSILLIRGQKVVLDTDLAELYGASTKAFNQAIKRNGGRFPPDFMFRLTEKEKREVVTNCDHLRKLKFSNALPAAFTEHGAIMAGTVLNTPRAITVSVYVVRAFVKVRELVNTQKEFARKLEDLEIYTRVDPSVKLEALESVSAPKLRTGRFKTTDKLIELLKAAPIMRSEKTGR